MSTEIRYGHIVNGSYVREGYTLEQVEDLCNGAIKFEESLDDVVGDLGVAPQIMKELVDEVKRLRAQVDASASA